MGSPTEALTILTLLLIAIGCLAIFTVCFVLFQHNTKRKRTHSWIKNKFIALSLTIAICFIVSESIYAVFISLVLGLVTNDNDASEKITKLCFFGTTVFDITGMFCHITLLYIRLLALLQADARSMRLRLLARVLVTVCVLFGLAAIFVYFMKLVLDVTESLQLALDLWFSIFSTLYGFALVVVDIVSTGCFYNYLSVSRQTFKGQKHVHTDESASIVATMGVAICLASLTGTIFYGIAAFAVDVFEREWLKLIMAYSIVIVAILWMAMKIRLDSLIAEQQQAEVKSSAGVLNLKFSSSFSTKQSVAPERQPSRINFQVSGEFNYTHNPSGFQAPLKAENASDANN
eukprot:TRINITY_DN6916_c0_g3_i1.p1 TRINITY_DN6916_c0_g3~~TRINITY_DN6916_c0_g3_i1.p1  ORF type:complete len:355 (-),score=65.54 TRINITY_DN6916_c0_g3_i1:30-1067(-)